MYHSRKEKRIQKSHSELKFLCKLEEYLFENARTLLNYSYLRRCCLLSLAGKEKSFRGGNDVRAILQKQKNHRKNIGVVSKQKTKKTLQS